MVPSSDNSLNARQPILSPTSVDFFREALRAEAEAIFAAAGRLGPEVEAAIELLRQIDGRVIFTGLGKTGYVARKAAATFCSTGCLAIFLHPAEALHGDLGIVTSGDILIALSNSGETAEVLELLPFIARLNVPVIAITGNVNSTLAGRSTLVIDAHVEREADEISITPTSSTTVAMAICDALAVTLMKEKGFTREQFAIFHPGGNLGRKLLLTVADLMRVGDSVPMVAAEQQLTEAIDTISAKKMGAVFVVSDQQALVGIVTDGDLRRLYQQPVSVKSTDSGQPQLAAIMTANPQSVGGQALAAEALKRMEDFQITVLPVVDADGKLVGAIHLHDLIRAGLA